MSESPSAETPGMGSRSGRPARGCDPRLAPVTAPPPQPARTGRSAAPRPACGSGGRSPPPAGEDVRGDDRKRDEEVQEQPERRGARAPGVGGSPQQPGRDALQDAHRRDSAQTEEHDRVEQIEGAHGQRAKEHGPADGESLFRCVPGSGVHARPSASGHNGSREAASPGRWYRAPGWHGQGRDSRRLPPGRAWPFLSSFPNNSRNARGAELTAAESGNSSATSGSRTTMLVPSAYRLAYFPRTPPERSYSGRIPATTEVSRPCGVVRRAGAAWRWRGRNSFAD